MAGAGGVMRRGRWAGGRGRIAGGHPELKAGEREAAALPAQVRPQEISAIWEPMRFADEPEECPLTHRTTLGR